MKKLILTMAAICLLSATSHAALPAFYDSVAKIKVALESAELAQEMKINPIESLSVEGSVVLIQSNGCGYAVHLNAQLPQALGATTYSVKYVVGPMCQGLAQ